MYNDNDFPVNTSSLTDDELLRMLSSRTLTPIEQELATRLERALDELELALDELEATPPA